MNTFAFGPRKSRIPVGSHNDILNHILVLGARKLTYVCDDRVAIFSPKFDNGAKTQNRWCVGLHNLWEKGLSYALDIWIRHRTTKQSKEAKLRQDVNTTKVTVCHQSALHAFTLTRGSLLFFLATGRTRLEIPPNPAAERVCCNQESHIPPKLPV